MNKIQLKVLHIFLYLYFWVLSLYSLQVCVCVLWGEVYTHIISNPWLFLGLLPFIARLMQHYYLQKNRRKHTDMSIYINIYEYICVLIIYLKPFSVKVCKSPHIQSTPLQITTQNIHFHKCGDVHVHSWKKKLNCKRKYR